MCRYLAVVSEDLREEESLLQMFDALEGLDLIATTVFNKISQRVRPSLQSCDLNHPNNFVSTLQVIEDRDRLVALNNRINVAHAKVQKLVGSTQATNIYSE
jgi:hypothetical protein